MLHVPGLYIAATDDRGRGVFTSETLSEGDLIEICPVIKIRKGQLKHIDPTVLYDYYFIWEESGYEAAIALGYGSLYNHSEKPNAKVIMDYSDDTIRIECLCKIVDGAEILIDYRDGDRDHSLWFTPL